MGVITHHRMVVRFRVPGRQCTDGGAITMEEVCFGDLWRPFSVTCLRPSAYILSRENKGLAPHFSRVSGMIWMWPPCTIRGRRHYLWPFIPLSGLPLVDLKQQSFTLHKWDQCRRHKLCSGGEVTWEAWGVKVWLALGKTWCQAREGKAWTLRCWDRQRKQANESSEREDSRDRRAFGTLEPHPAPPCWRNWILNFEFLPWWWLAQMGRTLLSMPQLFHL